MTMISQKPLGLGLVLLTLIPVALLEKDACPCLYGIPGLPGMPGMPGKDGRDGLAGAKGEKGVPATPGSLGIKGEKGDPGTRGVAGKTGPPGPLGPAGGKGSLGEQGEEGLTGNPKLLYQSAFTVAMQSGNHPKKNERLIFTRVISRTMDDYDTTTGVFTCRIAGVYYFTYHATQISNLCVILFLDGAKKSSFCEHMSAKEQVTSGGLLLAVKQGQAVWLEVNDYNGVIGIATKDSVFTGFLLFPD